MVAGNEAIHRQLLKLLKAAKSRATPSARTPIRQR